MHNELVNEGRAAERLGLSVSTLRAWRLSGRGPVFRKLGAAVRYAMSDLDAFVDASGRRSTSDRGTGDGA